MFRLNEHQNESYKHRFYDRTLSKVVDKRNPMIDAQYSTKSNINNLPQLVGGNRNDFNATSLTKPPIPKNKTPTFKGYNDQKFATKTTIKSKK